MRDPVVEQACQLSSGMMATITGQARYTVIDNIRAAFVTFCQEQAGEFACWQDAWQSFVYHHPASLTNEEGAA